jgi:tetratricopeptide (TPR) repeat protein
MKSGRQSTQVDNLRSSVAKLELETSETLFATLTALNACGFDLDLANSDPVRAQVRQQVTDVINASLSASNAREKICSFVHDKQQADPARDLAQYVSLALYMKEPPEFGTTTRESDLPPDAYEVLGFIPLLRTFYEATNLHAIWEKHAADYEKLIARVHDPISDMVLKTDFYLKLPQSSYLGRRYLVYVEPMGAPSQVNARNFGADYYLVISPGTSGVTHIEQIRHTYLHFILDTLVQRRAAAVKRLDPILLKLKDAPMDESFKNDTALLVIESLIQAIEARTMTLPGGVKDREALDKRRNEEVDADVKQGYVLTRYFYDALGRFEQEPTGLREAFAPMLEGIDVGREKRRAENTAFDTKAKPELVRASAPKKEPAMLDYAEDRLAQGDVAAAHKFAQQALDQHDGDPARAMFVLARAAILDKQVDDAQMLFERTLEIAHEPRTVAWSHIYLGRILDMKCDRPSAVAHYRTALSFAEPTPDIKAAADKGIKELPPVKCDKSDDKE